MNNIGEQLVDTFEQEPGFLAQGLISILRTEMQVSLLVVNLKTDDFIQLLHAFYKLGLWILYWWGFSCSEIESDDLDMEG